MPVSLVKLNLDDCVADILTCAGFSNPRHYRYKSTRQALEISLTDLARSPRNKTGHLHLAKVKGRRIVLQKAHWDAVAASVSFLRSLRESRMPPAVLHENSLVGSIARTCRNIHQLDDQQVQLVTTVLRIVEVQLRMRAETPGASLEEIATYLYGGGTAPPEDLESCLDDLTPAILQNSARHSGQRRFTAAC